MVILQFDKPSAVASIPGKNNSVLVAECCTSNIDINNALFLGQARIWPLVRTSIEEVSSKRVLDCGHQSYHIMYANNMGGYFLMACDELVISQKPIISWSSIKFY